MKKNLLLLKIVLLFIVLFTILNCPGAANPNYLLTVINTYEADVSSDIIVSATDESGNELPVFKTDNLSELGEKVFFIGLTATKNDLGIFFSYTTPATDGNFENFGIYKNKISDFSATYTIPPKTVSGPVYVAGGEYGGTLYTGVGSKTLKINYPETLSFSDNTVDVGDEITITSTKPFFDPATFSQTKLDTLIDNDYYIVWVEADDLEYTDYIEKRPVTKDYYVDVTTDSITFKIPPYAKTGKVHIINEAGFFVINTTDDLLVTDANAPAYYSSSVDLVVNN